ncbi:TIGR01777 family oxidoreductase [Asticcacaulis sp. BYS171W]|uniref:TIGR01777 family oxidoreductase n=1 Tax=Asticcacaulis aquaticus TaxID=2984212 RepID=A0ABT5HYS4_9CAUL|nr:TIGR01777 family oxidoreductase [Asticcacaulis aquaticus]MDC7684980.1 TIGR01777 family oxidoreductase [Asticcacaulis aquaticus]
MTTLLWLMTIQGVMGAFDTLYHHEFTERLPWKPQAGRELFIHGLRNLFYGLIFASLGGLSWGGVWAGVFAALLIAEIGLTLWDFVVEDQSRHLPPSERITHTLLAINYGLVLAFLAPELMRWETLPSGFHPHDYGLGSWIMYLFAAGVWGWAGFDLLRSRRFRKLTAVPSLHLDTPNQRVLITGGTGLIGSRLTQGLIDDGHQVTILTRDKAQAAKFRGPLTVIDHIDDLRAPVDLIINLAGESLSGGLWTRRRIARFYDSRLGITGALIDWIARQPVKPKRLINASAIGIYGRSETEIFDEASAPAAPDLATDLCTKWETLALTAQNHGVPVSLIRFGLVLSVDGGALAQMLFPFEFGIGGRLGSGRQWISWIHIDDAVGMVVHAANAGLDGTVNATAPVPVRNAGFTRALGRAMHRPVVLPLPGFVLKRLLGQMADILLLNGQQVLPARATHSGYRFRYPQIDAALNALFRGRM